MTNSDHIRDEELELYALGGMPELEAEALKAHVAVCGECAMKLAESRGSAALLSFAVKQEHPAGTIKAELLSRIHANRAHEEDYAWPVPAPERPETGGLRVGKSARNKTSPWWNWIVVPAALLLALVSLALSYQNHKVSQALEKQRQAAQALLQEREKTEKLVGILAAADTVTVRLAPAAEAAGSGVVRYNARLGMLVYSALLPEVPAGKSYQMWLVPTVGSPINAGLLEKDARASTSVWLAQVPANTDAKAFAITVEPTGGSSQPTGPKVLIGAT